MDYVSIQCIQTLYECLPVSVAWKVSETFILHATITKINYFHCQWIILWVSRIEIVWFYVVVFFFAHVLDDLPSTNDDIDQENESIAEDKDGQPKAPVKKKRTRKQVSTVTTNKSTLNSRLELIQMPDSLYFQLNSIMGENSSSNKLLVNLLQTKFSDLKLTMNDQFWDDRQYEPIAFNDDDSYDTNDTEYIELPIKLKADTRHTLRQQMKGYTISNTPIDDDEEWVGLIAQMKRKDKN